MCHYLGLLHGPDVCGQKRTKEEVYKCGDSAIIEAAYCVAFRICAGFAAVKDKIMRNTQKFGCHSFTQHRQEMNVRFDSWLDTNLKQYSKKYFQSVKHTVESGARETFKTHSSYLPWKMRNMLLEMSCLQSKSISASVAGKTQRLLEGSKELPGILCIPLHQHLQQFSAQGAHNAHSLPTNSIQKIRGARNGLFHQIISVLCQDKSWKNFLTILQCCK